MRYERRGMDVSEMCLVGGKAALSIMVFGLQQPIVQAVENSELGGEAGDG
jgi:hypothetical protein